jgi:hypothetical protein
MVISLLVLTFLACGETSPETLVEELRVVASISAPPEVRPGETFEYTTFVANPDEAEVDVLTWVCTNLGDGCLEAAGGTVSISHSVSAESAPTLARTLGVSPALAGILPETGPITATQVWTLLCEKGACPLIDEVGDTTGIEPWPSSIQDLLSNPLDWMTDVPTSGTSLAYQLITTSLSDAPHENPTIMASPENATFLTKNEAFSLEFQVRGTLTEDARLYNYISAGGFEMTDTFVTADECTFLNGVAPEKEDQVTVWVVLLDGLGGVDVWSTQMEVR